MKTTKNLARLMSLVALVLFAAVSTARAIIADSAPFEHTQPDGTKVMLQLHGDEFFHWYSDLEGFTVLLQGKQYVYARLDSQGGLVPTTAVAGSADPRTLGLAANLLPPSTARTPNINQSLIPYRPWLRKSSDLPGGSIRAEGTVTNLVILCMFSDHTAGVHTRARADYDVLYNRVGGDPVLAPTGSVRDAYEENSYRIVHLGSRVLAWVTLPHDMAYYAGTNNGGGCDAPANAYCNSPNNCTQMVKDALALVASSVNFAEFDLDNDGYVDAIDFIHSGYGAEATGAPANSIWSRRWSLAADWESNDRNSNGVKVKVRDFHTEPALRDIAGTDIVRIGVICHETGHFFGLPDLYDTDGSSAGIGSWCMMANPWGFDNSQRNPPHFSAWCKVFLGWVNPVDLPATGGNWSLGQVETLPNIIRITNGYPSGEYLLLENRQPVGLDALIPQGGLAIWHIDENRATTTNKDNAFEGFPGQANWPQNGNHYRVALLQADGRYDLEMTVKRGDKDDLYRGGGQDHIDMNTSPSTDAYQGGNAYPTCNIISQISPSYYGMTFRYSFYAHPLFVDRFYGGGVTDGTFAHPYRQVRDAYNAARDGDTIVIRGADYLEAPPTLSMGKRVGLAARLGNATVR